MTSLSKNETIQKFRTAVRAFLIRLKLRKPKSMKIGIGKYERDMHGTVDDSELRTRSSSIKSVLSNYNSSNSDHESVISYETEYCDRDILYRELVIYSASYYPKKKRLPNTGSNFSKTPVLFEIPKIPHPAAWVSSKTQNDTKPIKN